MNIKLFFLVSIVLLISMSSGMYSMEEKNINEKYKQNWQNLKAKEEQLQEDMKAINRQKDKHKQSCQKTFRSQLETLRSSLEEQWGLDQGTLKIKDKNKNEEDEEDEDRGINNNGQKEKEIESPASVPTVATPSTLTQQVARIGGYSVLRTLLQMNVHLPKRCHFWLFNNEDIKEAGIMTLLNNMGGSSKAQVAAVMLIPIQRELWNKFKGTKAMQWLIQAVEDNGFVQSYNTFSKTNMLKITPVLKVAGANALEFGNTIAIQEAVRLVRATKHAARLQDWLNGTLGSSPAIHQLKSKDTFNKRVAGAFNNFALGLAINFNAEESNEEVTIRVA